MSLASIGVTLLSGGLDSSTVTAYARKKVGRLTAVTFHYGQLHSKEVQCAVTVASALGIGHEVVDLSGYGRLAWYSSLTSPERYAVPMDRGELEVAGPGQGSESVIPNTYVPLRNTVFLALATALLESQALYSIEAEGEDPRKLEAHIFLAPNAIDYSGYPDCRPEYYEKIRGALMFGSKLWTQYHVPLEIDTPIIDLSKAEIVKMGMELKAPLEHTWSCYQDGKVPCGRCDSCMLRAKGFAGAGYQDPLLVRLGRVSP